MQEPSLKTTNNSDIHKTINNTRIKAPLLKIILIGDSGVGKTTLIHSFVNNGKLREEFKQSVGIDYIMKKMDLGSKVYVRFEIVSIYIHKQYSGIQQEMKNFVR